MPGADLEKMFLLRAPDDADRIIAAAGQAQQVVVVGTGFIGMETAAALRQRGLAVTVVGAGGNAPGEGAGERNRGDVAETARRPRSQIQIGEKSQPFGGYRKRVRSGFR